MTPDKAQAPATDGVVAKLVILRASATQGEWRELEGVAPFGEEGELFVGQMNGIAVRYGMRGFAIAAPWNRPLFSEREGHRRPIFRLLGWRLFRLAPITQRSEETTGG